MAILSSGKLTATYAGQFDKQLHSVEWFVNGKWKRILDTTYPHQDVEVLDDTLDYGSFQFTNEETAYPDDGDISIPIAEKLRNLKQFTPIRILWDSADAECDFSKPITNPIWRYRVVGSVGFKQNGRLYKFFVKTVEATKLLERDTCDTMTFTNKLGVASFALNSEEAFAFYVAPETNTNEYEYKYETPRRLQTEIILNTCRILPVLSIIERYKYASTTVTKYCATEVVVITPDSQSVSLRYYEYADAPNQQSITYTFDKIGKYQVRYYIRSANTSIYPNQYYVLLETLVKDVRSEDKPSLTIADCFQRIVEFGKTRRTKEPQKFFMAHSVIDKFANVRAPEFHITRSTMWEALKTVAGHIHCIPRLIWNDTTNAFDTVTLDELGGSKKCELKAKYGNKPIAWDLEKNLDSYCGQIESYVDNLVNTQNFDEGTVEEPFGGGWISARASDGQLEVKDDTVCFKMSRPGYRVTKLEIRTNQNGKPLDITPYLYEASEYETLSNFEGAFPNSTAFALKYTQGGNEIGEIAHCADKSLSMISDVSKTEAILNIISLISETERLSSGHFKNIQYRVTYSPIVSARIVQKKQFLEDATDNTMFYNASANLVESEYYGEHLKGAIARLGNDNELRTYLFDRCKDIPSPGEILDGLYISKVITEITSRIYTKVTLVLSKDYNQKNEYVAIDSNFRLYDVSEKQSVDRLVNYGENVVIGNEITNLNNNKQMATVKSVEIFRDCFNGNTGDLQISWASFQGKSKIYGNYTSKDLKKIILPCLSQAVGNSLLFNFACKDNYGAGYQITNEYHSEDKNKKDYRASQSLVSYGNIYGEFETMDLCLGNYEGIGDANRDSLPKVLPEWTQASLPNGLFSTGNYPLNISKDSRECINFTYQLHFVVNRRDIIVGPALGQNNPLVTNNKGKQATCYLLAEPLNKFADYVNLTKGATKITSGYLPSTATLTEKKFCLPAITNTTTFTAKAIAWVDESGGGGDGKLIIGENIEILPSGRSKEIWFNFTANC